MFFGVERHPSWRGRLASVGVLRGSSRLLQVALLLILSMALLLPGVAFAQSAGCNAINAAGKPFVLTVNSSTVSQSIGGLSTQTNFKPGEVVSYAWSINTTSGTIGARVNYQVQNSGGTFVNLVGGDPLTGYTPTSGSSEFTTPSNLARMIFTANGNTGGASGAGTVSYTLSCRPLAPTISSIAPASGVAGGGTSVTITGVDLANATSVTFGGTSAAIVSNTSTQIVATAPAGSGTVDIRVTTPGGTTANTGADDYRYVAPPSAPVVTAPANGSTVSATPTYSGTANANVTVTIYVDNASIGTVNSGAGGAWSFPQPSPLASGSHTVYATATNTDGLTGPNSNTNTFTVTPAPVASNYTLPAPVNYNSGSNTPANFSLSGQVTNNPTSYAVGSATTANGGSVSIDNSGTATYIPPRSFRGNDSFTYTASNAGGTSSPATVTVPVGNPTLSTTLSGSGTRGVALSGVQVIPSGGTAPYSCGTTLVSGAIPAGTTIQANCSISGTPAASGTFNFAVNVTDSSNPAFSQSSRQLTLVVAAPNTTLSPSAGALPGATAGAAYSQSFVAASGTAPYSYQLTGALPAGMTFTGGLLSGTPTTTGTYNFTVSATDSSTVGSGGPYSVSNSYSLTVAAPVIVLTPSTLPNGTVGASYTTGVSASGGIGGYSYAVTAGALPAGVTLASSGAISGTPSAGGTFNVSITATDSSGNSGVQGYAITIGVPTVTVSPSTLAAATAGTSYSATITATGGTAGYVYAVTSGALPAGLSLATGGTLSGTPSAPGSFAFTVTATDSSTGTGAPYSGSRAYTLSVTPAPVVIDQASLPNSRAGTPYSQTLTATGGNGSYSFAVTAGALPPGWTLSTAGVLSGTATASNNFSFTITATDSSTGTGAPYSGSRAYSVSVNSPNFTLTPPTLSATVGAPYTGNFVAGGGTAPYSYSRVAGTIPPGLTLAANGTLSGTPTAGGSFNFTVIARDSTTGVGAPYAVGSGYTFTVAAPSLSLAPATLAGGTVGTAYSQTIGASGGVTPFSYAITAGSLPAGMSIDSTTGTISGTPTIDGSFNFTVTATDSSTGAGAPYSASRAYTLVIAAPTVTITPTVLPSGTPGTTYSQTLAVSGGTAPYTLAITSGALPAGLSLNAGVIVGTPTVSGAFSFTVTATDSSASTYSGSRAYTLTIGSPTITVDTATLPDATVAVSYSQTIAASGGVGPYSYAVTAGALPTGVTLSSGGLLSGTPGAGGTFTFTVTATDASAGAGPFSGSRSLTLTVVAPAITVGPATLPAADVGVAYSQALTASGGTGTYSYAVTSGALPAGMSLSTTGVLSGTPSAGGTFNVTITATDSSTGSGPYSGSTAYGFVVATPSLTLSPATLATAETGVAYSASISASGGTWPYSYAIGSGALPAGITLAADGTLSGTPSAGGNFNFTVTATDNSTGTGAPYSVSRAYSLSVAAATIVLAPATLPDGRMGAAYSGTISASGGVAPYAYTVTAGTLPAGVSLSGTGTLAGTPGVNGTFNFTVTATDSSGGAGPYSASRAYMLVIAAPDIPVAGGVSATVAFGSSGNAITPALSGGTATSLSIATAPAHGTATVDGLSISYTPAPGYFGADSFTYTASNAGGTSAPATVTLNVTTPPAPVAADLANVAVAHGSTGTAIDLSGSITGVHTSIAIATSPAHGTVSVSGDTVSYAPTAGYFGADSFTYTASGPGGTSAAATVTLQVAVPPAPVAGSRGGVAIAYNSGGTAIDLAGDISGVYTSVAIATAPAHGTATIVGTVVTYTPNPDYHGADSFTYTATGPGGTSAPATIGLTVAAPPPPQADDGASSVPASTTTTGQQSVDVDLSALVTGDYDRIEIQRQPAHGTVTLRGNPAARMATATANLRSSQAASALAGPRVVATYTPATGFVGTDAFTFVAVGPGGASAEASVGIQVVGQAPVAQPKTAQIGDGQTVSVVLTDGATEGPFTDATIVGVTPGDQVTATIVATEGAYRLDVTPAAHFGGTIVVTYTLTNAFGVSAPAAVSVTVTARPDPSADAAVRAISDAQAETTRRFARSQVANFMRRTEQLHGNGGGSGGAAMGLTLNSRDGAGLVQMPQPLDQSALEITERMHRSSAEDPAWGRLATARNGMGVNRADSLAMAGAAAELNATERNAARKASGLAGDVQPLAQDAQGSDGTRRPGSIGVWSGGAIDIGTQDATTNRSKISATTSGLSAGADLKLAEGITIGIGGGYGNDLSRIDGGAARIRADSTVVALYGSATPFADAFVDGMIGRGDLNFRTRRRVSDTGATALGNRDGDFTVGALALGIDRRGDRFSWSLYGRGEALDATLGTYVESGADRLNLRFDKRSLTSITGTLGARFELTQKYAFGAVTPRLRVEWNHEFADADAQRLDYADIVGSTLYGIDTQGWSREQFQLSLGTRFLLPSLWAFDLETGFRGASGQRASSVRAQISKEF